MAAQAFEHGDINFRPERKAYWKAVVLNSHRRVSLERNNLEGKSAIISQLRAQGPLWCLWLYQSDVSAKG